MTFPSEANWLTVKENVPEEAVEVVVTLTTVFVEDEELFEKFPAIDRNSLSVFISVTWLLKVNKRDLILKLKSRWQDSFLYYDAFPFLYYDARISEHFE